MDVDKAGCYKLYKCRSLLACDSGGTVYDTSQKYEDPDSETFYKNPDENQSESGQSENIIYIIDKNNEVKTSNNSLSQPPLTDPITHLDDDEFNEPCSNISHDSEYDILQYVKEENIIENENCKYYMVQCDEIESSQNSTTETLDSDSFDRENFEYYRDSTNLSSLVDDTSINLNNDNAVSENFFIYNHEETEPRNLSNISHSTARSFESQDTIEFENYSPLYSEIESNVMHARKRKQTYNVKNNSFTELLEDDDLSDSSLVDDVKRKKQKSIIHKDNQRKKLQYQNNNPFENLKMSSILKQKRSSKKQVCLKDYRRESLTSSNDENSEPSNVSSNDEEVFNYSEGSYQSRYSFSFPSNSSFPKNIDTSIKLNSELTNADYLEYVQPRERIVESDMDKLLSPTIEVEMSSIMKNCSMNQFMPQRQGQVDCNGNEVDLKESGNNNSNSKTTPSEVLVLEKQLISKSALAIKLGYENIFNTSNQCLMNEILFDQPFTYKDVQLEIDLCKIKEDSVPKVPFVLLEDIREYMTEHHSMSGPFKNVSCSLQDTLNEFNNFGGFLEDNNNEQNKINPTEEVPAEVQYSKDMSHFYYPNTYQKQDEFTQFRPNSYLNYSTTAYSVGSDFNANYNPSKYLPSTSFDNKWQVAPLKMKIKKVNDENNEYVIDDSSNYNFPADKTSKFQKNSDSKYECSDCSEKFRTKKMLKSHVSENHKGPYDMECEICHTKSKKSSAHKKHQQWCIRSTALTCSICQKKYCYRAVLAKHLKTHEASGI